MDEKVAQILREKFRPEEVGKLPRVTCPKCAARGNRGQCEEHSKAKCNECGAYVSVRHIHIDYVGHADVTSRLLAADPEWSWEPQARDIDPAVLAAAVATGSAEVIAAVLRAAPPKFDLDDQGSPVGLWITLTVAGTTRPGYGSCPSGQADAVKVLIGDSLRNAAMRFGVALDLWAKGDREDPTAENATASAGQARRGRAPSAAKANGNGHAKPAETDIDWMGHLVDDLIPAASTREELTGFWTNVASTAQAGKCTAEHAQQIRAMVTERSRELGLEKTATA